MADRKDNPRKAARAREAAAHTEQMAARYGREIEACAAAVRRVEGAPAFEVEGRVPSVRVLDVDAVSAILENGRGRAQFCDLAVLDFASFVNPGGGYVRGSMAQEEALCAESYLYNVLEGMGDWYAENRRRNLNCELYRNRALVVPAVRFGRDRVHAYADVIVAAAPNLRRARADYGVADEVAADAMRDRIRFALSLIDAQGREKAVLGAFGCGVFGWDASVVAKMFHEELAGGTHGLSEAIFAIPNARYDDNLARFEHAFAAFPEVNPTSYDDVAARRAEVRAAEEAAREAERDDDWRQYL
ncbi:MAG: TIGR02452 family protein [Collinsella sp.]|nr:TIGR02452 family protein [Collinsella sp.]